MDDSFSLAHALWVSFTPRADDALTVVQMDLHIELSKLIFYVLLMPLILVGLIFAIISALV